MSAEVERLRVPRAMLDERIGDWRVSDDGTGRGVADSATKDRTDVEVFDGGLYVKTEGGSGYETFETSVFLPRALLLRLLGIEPP